LKLHHAIHLALFAIAALSGCTENATAGGPASAAATATSSGSATTAAAPATPPDAVKKLLAAAREKPEEHKDRLVTLDGLFRGTTINGFGDAATYAVGITDDKESMTELFCSGKGSTAGTSTLKQYDPIRVEGKLAIGKAMKGDKEITTVGVEECKVTAR